MKKLLSPKQVAQAINVSESSLKRWCDQGVLSSIRTAGGHRRLTPSDVFEFLRVSGNQLVRPELLGLPAATGRGETCLDRVHEQLHTALTAGDEEQCRRIVFDLYLSGQKLHQICDRVLAPAMHDIGHDWETNHLPVYRERRACGIILNALVELRLAMPAVPHNAPRALGGTLSGDPYQLPTAMIDLTLHEHGWQATSLGSQLPAQTFIEAIRDHHPQLLWLSISTMESVDEFLRQYTPLQQACGALGVAMVVGGRALTTEVRQQITYSAYCDTLRHIVAFVSSLPWGETLTD